MKSNSINLKYLVLMTGIILFTGCKQKVAEEESFTFAFLTDIHVQPEKNATEGFKKAIEAVNERKPDFVITGGDLIMDALGQTYGRADSLYNLYDETAMNFSMPVYNTMGNHEVFGYYESSGVDSTHALYGDKLYQERLGNRYQAFDHKGWRFYIFDSIDEWEEGGYYGYIDEEQINWLKEDLANVDPETPICISVHIPFITVTTQINNGSMAQNSRGLVITNSKEVLDLFADHNLKLVLQGHLHVYEDLYINDIHFITGGAVSGSWWNGPRGEMEEGFLMVELKGDRVSSEYIDFGWEVVE
jgi:3',5'-cyclic AMP phosphodiesterase CpdA